MIYRLLQIAASKKQNQVSHLLQAKFLIALKCPLYKKPEQHYSSQ